MKTSDAWQIWWPCEAVLQLASCIVSHSIVVVAAKGIEEHLNPARLREHGWDMDMHVRQKGTKAARKLPSDFEDVKII